MEGREGETKKEEEGEEEKKVLLSLALSALTSSLAMVTLVVRVTVAVVSIAVTSPQTCSETREYRRTRTIHFLGLFLRCVSQRALCFYIVKRLPKWS